ncbi:hypothetical protein CHS0354_006937 [Potamilus streckersoni]|uniref:Multifunctional fusion protein n=1 Tax=Potamilus streckersoni TaxID=2493646 RepID=A0AAE0WBV5_9BIVA|nr:hypothetical protein CHS0354_006937 [Potamilus streckersoni]
MSMSTRFFSIDSPICYEGPQTDNPLAFRYYDPTRLVNGKSMKEHLRFAVCYWHNFVGNGSDPFGEPTFPKFWANYPDPIDAAKAKADYAFQLFKLLDVPYFCFHDADVVSLGNSFAEGQRNLAVSEDILRKKMDETGIKLLWGTANLFSHKRYMAGAATSPEPDVFAYAAAQVKNALEMTHRLKGENYVLWGGREGYDTLMNTDLKRELDQLARFLSLVVNHKHKIGFKGTLLIEPKPQEPTKHQYDYDVASVYGFLKHYGLEKEFKVNIEANHATLAGHTFEHEIALASVLGIFGSLDMNRGDDRCGWDTDQFPNNLHDITLAMYEVLKAGGFTTGGLNFDAKLRRQSIDHDDLLYAHIGGMDICARGLLTENWKPCAPRAMRSGRAIPANKSSPLRQVWNHSMNMCLSIIYLHRSIPDPDEKGFDSVYPSHRLIPGMVHLQDKDDILSVITAHLHEENLSAVENILSDLKSNDIAYVLCHTDRDEFSVLLPMVINYKPADLAEIVPELSSDALNRFIEYCRENQLERLVKDIFREIFNDDAVSILSSLHKDEAAWLSRTMDNRDYALTRMMLEYPEESAGRMMSTDFISAPSTHTVLEALNLIKERGEEVETANYVYVTDNEGILKGVVSLRELVFQPNNRRLADIMNDDVIHIETMTDQEEAAKAVEHYNLSAIPVTDNGVLKGIITVDDVIDIIRAETTEDIMKLAGSASGDIYSAPSPIKSALRRFPWLAVAFMGGMITVKIMGWLSDAIPRIEFLAFVPVIGGMSGNVANQASTVIVRGLATGKIHISRLRHVLISELLTALILGTAFGGMLYFTSELEFEGVVNLGITVSAAIICSMLAASFFGSTVPMLFNALSIDPAIATGPFVTVSIDIVGMLIYMISIHTVVYLTG